MTPVSRGARLIVNADDYGYFHCVSRGILESAATGIVTATGIFANSPHFDEHVRWLKDFAGLDVGIHLNLTDGAPLTNDMRRRLTRWSGRFPRKYPLAMALLSGAIKIEDVKIEWRAQIERCVNSGMPIRFVNSHEHMHMLPALFLVASALAKEYDIAHVRFPASQLALGAGTASILRGAIVKGFEMINRRYAAGTTAQFLGLEASGKLGLPYLQHCLSRLRPGRIYELMCHPGRLDAQEIDDPRLRSYHDWEGELRTLTSPAVRGLLQRYGIELIGYRHIEPQTRA